ncbi:MAG: RNA polymerase sigma factor [Bacteroidia bacterium]|nr:RNA polymerase sigma factor [Bacteroidia bacterium]
MEKIKARTLKDAELIQGCINNCSYFQRKLYDKYSAKMFSVCLRYSDNYHTAEDLLQDGFVKVYKNISKFRGEGSFEGWIRRIFVNTAIEAYRKSSKMFTIHQEDVVDSKYFDDSTIDNLLEKDVLSLVQSLTPGYRTIFNLYVIEGFNHREISEKLNISEGTSKSQLARARYILQKKVLNHYKVAMSSEVG